jgi:hypothetical protein
MPAGTDRVSLPAAVTGGLALAPLRVIPDGDTYVVESR